MRTQKPGAAGHNGNGVRACGHCAFI
jgi:hypothetical protein